VVIIAHFARVEDGIVREVIDDHRGLGILIVRIARP